MLALERLVLRSRLLPHASSLRPQPCRCFATARSDEKWPQRIALGRYYESILNDQTESKLNAGEPEESLPEGNGRTKTPLNRTVSFDTSPPSPPPLSAAEEKARIIFGSRLVGPAEREDRLAQIKARSTYVAGVLVPPRPEEPDNCCMSGCVNCVWDRYGEELEEWTAKKKESEERLQMDASKGRRAPSPDEKRVTKEMWAEDALSSVPVGIREFMKTEKRLREKHDKEGTLGG